MKAHLTKLSLALLSTAFLLGCQDLGSGPVGPEVVPQFGGPHHPGPHGGDGDGVEPGDLFKSLGFTCGGGAASTDDGPFGNVNFNQPRDDSHMHANVQLRGAPPGDYDIFGNQELVCDLDSGDDTNTSVDFLPRPLHATTVTVGANGKGKARIGLDFGSAGDVAVPASHAPGPHNLWVTLVGTSGDADGVVLRSTAVEVVIAAHDGH